jgi:hypothetical protein
MRQMPFKLTALRSVTAVLIASGALSCGDTEMPPTGPVLTDTTPPPGGVTYHKDIRPLLETHCTTCHEEGFPWGDWTRWGSITGDPERGDSRAMITGWVALGIMPPWHADLDCRSIKDARVLSSEETALFADWQAAGHPEGDSSVYVAPNLKNKVDNGPPTITLTPKSSYTVTYQNEDDYRCISFDTTFDTQTFVRGTDVEPGNLNVVHHALIFSYPTSSQGEFDALSDAEPEQIGFTCPGGPAGITGVDFLGGWVPGMQPVFYRDGAALIVPANSRVLMQVHYTMLNLSVGQSAEPDITNVLLWTMPKGDYPTEQVRIDRRFAKHDISIPVDAKDLPQTATIEVMIPGKIIGSAPHMHLIGRALTSYLKRPGQDDICIANIPEWDFNWQQLYIYEESDYVDVSLGDTLDLTCVFSNTAEIWAKGLGISPDDVVLDVVKWGDDTTDEMCINYTAFLSPYYGTGDGKKCDGFEPCYASCKPGDAICFANCLAYVSNECLECGAVGFAKECGQAYCATGGLSALNTCLTQCATNKKLSLIGCAATDCGSEFLAAYECLEPHIRNGDCDAHVTACDIALVD